MASSSGTGREYPPELVHGELCATRFGVLAVCDCGKEAEPAADPVVSPAETPAISSESGSAPESRSGSKGSRPTDSGSEVSPADTIRQLRLRVERKYTNEVAEQKNSGHGQDVTAWLASVSYSEWFTLTDALDALLAERERDRQRIARLTEVERIAAKIVAQPWDAIRKNDLADLRGALADVTIGAVLAAIFGRYGYDPDDPVRGLDVPDKLRHALEEAPLVKPGAPLDRRYLHDTAPTLRELQVVELLACGYEVKEIAAMLHLSKWTVKDQLKLVYRKLGARNRAHAVALAVAQRMIPLA